jgi:hypothetical protein
MSPYSAIGIYATYVQALKAMSTVLADCSSGSIHSADEYCGSVLYGS